MHPPELLIPFQLHAGRALAVQKIENAAVLLVPAVFGGIERDSHRFVDQRTVVETHAEVHNEPHRFERMSGIHLTALERIGKLSVLRDSLDDQPQLFPVKHLHHFVQALPDRVGQQLLVDHRLDLQRHVAEDHRQSETLERTRSGISLAPLAFGIGAFLQNPVESPLGDQGVFVAARRNGDLRKSHRRERIGENIIGLHQRAAFARQRKIPVVVAVVAVFAQELAALSGTFEPFGTILHLVAQHREEPYLASLQPDELVRIVDAAVAIQATEVASALLVLGVLQPEGQYVIEKFGFGFFSQWWEIHVCPYVL